MPIARAHIATKQIHLGCMLGLREDYLPSDSRVCRAH